MEAAGDDDDDDVADSSSLRFVVFRFGGVSSTCSGASSPPPHLLRFWDVGLTGEVNWSTTDKVRDRLIPKNAHHAISLAYPRHDQVGKIFRHVFLEVPHCDIKVTLHTNIELGRKFRLCADYTKPRTRGTFVLLGHDNVKGGQKPPRKFRETELRRRVVP